MKTLGRAGAQTLVTLVVAALAACGGGGGANVRSDAASLNGGPRAAIIEGRSQAIAAIMTDLYDEGEWNAVLNFSRLGQAAFRAGDLELAAKALDQAIIRIEAVYANTAAAKRARSTWTSEATKDFKGEPYERAMVYYYRGLVDLALGDFENARASFLSGEFQDTLSEKEEYRSDFALLNWLSGWASHCASQSGLARDYFGFANLELNRRDGALWQKKDWMPTLEPYLQVPADTNRTLFITESGTGPVKRGTGEHNSILSFGPGTPAARILALRPDEGDLTYADWLALSKTEQIAHSVSMAERWGNAWAGELLHYQAMTRGGRPIDGVLAGQAKFKDTAGAVGEVAVAAGTQVATQALLYGDSDLAQLGGALALVGLFASMSSAAAKPAADTRAWLSLPYFVQASSLASAIDKDLVVQMHSIDGKNEIEYRPQLDVTAGGCRLVYAVTPEALASVSSKQNRGAMTDRERSRLLRRNARRDNGFRSSLLAEFVKPVDVETRLADLPVPDREVQVASVPMSESASASADAVASASTEHAVETIVAEPAPRPVARAEPEAALAATEVSRTRPEPAPRSAARPAPEARTAEPVAAPAAQGSSLDLDALWSDLDFASDDAAPATGGSAGEAGRR